MSRTALVTGGARGLGAAISIALAEAGHRVAVNYFASETRAQRLCADLRARDLVAQPFHADVRDPDEVARLVREVESSLGPIEIAVFNATGPQPMLSIEKQTWQAYLDQLEFFVKSPLLIAQAVLPAMRARGFGRIIQIGSEVVELGNPRFANYVAAKGAQLGQTRSWARELGPTGITVNLVAPGWIPTERHANDPESEKLAYAQAVPLQHQGVPADIGHAVAFLASDTSAFITGQKISVNGGNTLL
jgi:3-oxoacyl-[acyl-carrier protein] reductase